MTQLQEKIINLFGQKLDYQDIANKSNCNVSYVQKVVTMYLNNTFPSRRNKKYKNKCKCPFCGKIHFICEDKPQTILSRVFCPAHESLRERE